MSTDRTAYLDCSSGVSGDKLLGALLDAGSASGEFTAEHLRETVRATAPDARIDVERVLSHGTSAVSVRVSADGEPPHRRWREIEELIGRAAIPESARLCALTTFEALAVAEASVHGVAPSDVHFHEVGAIDSIADIVGVCTGISALRIGTVVASTVAVGGGTVQSSHGVLPVPAPATAALLAGMPVVGGPVASELTTPTGAALLRGLACEFGAIPTMTVEATGRGAGTRDIGIPNVCQVLVGTTTRTRAPRADQEPVILLETNIDHLPAEELAFAAEELLGAGALDVWQTPIVMKKGRSAIMLSALCSPDRAEELSARAIELTGSLGVRQQAIVRSCVPRQIAHVETAWGPARVKMGAGRVRPEHDDVARIAREHSLPYSFVVREIARIAETTAAPDKPSR
jgi:uncharacterized protein (TIGR00299 family) protein